MMALLPAQTEAKDKIYLNRTKITLSVGQTKKLSLIRNKKFVIVSTDGYIRTYFKPDKGKAYFDQQ